MNPKYIRMPQGSIVRVEDERIVETTHPTAIIISFAVWCIAAFALGFILLAL